MATLPAAVAVAVAVVVGVAKPSCAVLEVGSYWKVVCQALRKVTPRTTWFGEPLGMIPDMHWPDSCTCKHTSLEHVQPWHAGQQECYKRNMDEYMPRIRALVSLRGLDQADFRVACLTLIRYGRRISPR